MTDFRQLCRDLMDALDSGIPGARIQCSPLAERARAALAEFKSERLTDDDVDRWFQQWWQDEGSGMPPRIDEDGEEHVYRVSRIAWHNGAYCANV